MIQDPAGFRPLQPSRKFTARWNRSHSRVALFLVLSVPMTISPILAVRQIQKATLTGDHVRLNLFGWLAMLFVFAGIFHVSGTRILLEMHNGHLRIEALNRELLDRASGWLPEGTQSVLDETRPDAERPGSSRWRSPAGSASRPTPTSA